MKKMTTDDADGRGWGWGNCKLAIGNRQWLALAIAMLAGMATAPAQDGGFVRVNQLGRSVEAVRIVMVTNTNPTLVLSNTVSRSEGRVVVRRLQNIGTAPLFYGLGTTNVTTNSFHGILAAATAFNNGTGGIVDLSAWPGLVTAVTGPGATNLVATMEVTQ